MLLKQERPEMDDFKRKKPLVLKEKYWPTKHYSHMYCRWILQVWVQHHTAHLCTVDGP